MHCIFHLTENDAKTIEHIVSESFGNHRYVMARGAVCDECNKRFSGFEGKALSNTIFGMERARHAVITKKGNNVKSKISELEIIGSEDFVKQKITVKGLAEENLKDFDPTTGIGKLVVKSFDKSESATSKLLLKIGLESLFTSQKKVYEKYDFTELRNYLLGVSNTDWPFMTTDFEPDRFKSVPTFFDKYYLKRIHCRLFFCECADGSLLFNFKYGSVAMTINLIDRSDRWIQTFTAGDSKARLYPEHYRRKFKIVYSEDQVEAKQE